MGDFTGFMDVDSDERNIPKGYYRYANCIVKSTDHKGAVKNLLGNEEVEYELPEGNNEVIGCEEDTVCNTVVYFVKNSNGNDLILRYFPEEGVIRKVFLSPAFHFNNPIHSARIIDGRYLVWTDSRWSKDGMTGNCPRIIDMDLATSEGKDYIYCAWFEDYFFDNHVTEWEFTIQVYHFGDLENDFTFNFQHSESGLSRTQVLEEFGEALIAADTTGKLSYEVCNNEIKIMNTDPERVVIMSEDSLEFDIYLSNQLSGLLENIDANFPNDDPRLCLIKPAMLCEPEPFFLHTDVSDSFVYGKPYKFIARYIFKDGMTSAWSPESYVPTNFIANEVEGDIHGFTTEMFNEQGYDTIKITLENRFLSDHSWREILEYVEIGFKNARDEFFKTIGRINVSELRFDGTDWYYLFYDNLPSFVAASDDNGNADEQTFKPYDFTPVLSEALEHITDDDGNSLIVLGNNLQGYDADDCVKGDVALDYVVYEPPEDSNTQQGSIKDFKAGGIYPVYVVYYDFFGRRSLAKFIKTIEIPFRASDMVATALALNELTITFESKPPVWAHSFKIAVGRNQRQGIYKQYPCRGSSSVRFEAETNGFVDLGVGYDANATHLEFALLYKYPYVVGNVNIGDNNYFFNRDNIGDAMTPAQGDKMVFVQSTPLSTSSMFPELGGFTLDIDGFWLGVLDGVNTVDFLSVFTENNETVADLFSLRNLNPIVEIYRTVRDSGLAYELPGCYAVQNIGSDERSHGDPVVIYGIGDTYISSVDIKEIDDGLIRWGLVERPTLYHGDTDMLNDLGRGVAVGVDEQEERLNEFVLSDLMSPGKYSGINAFRSGERRNSKREFGAIRKIIRNDAVLLVVHQYASQPFYINKGQLLDASGNTALARTDRLLNMGNELDKQLGTHHPESVVLYNGKVYCFDGNKGIVWRYTNGGGQYEISMIGMDTFFRGFNTTTGIIKGGIEPKRLLYHLKLPETPVIAFMEEGDKGGWLGFFPFEPDDFGWVGARFITFKNGKLYVHDQGDWNTFYGQTFQSMIEPVFKEDFDRMKRYHVLREINSLWTADKITTENQKEIGIMESRLNQFRFKFYEGDYTAEFLKDMEDPRFFNIADDAQRRGTSLFRGRELRSHSLTLRLGLVDNTQEQVLRAYEIEYSLSNKT